MTGIKYFLVSVRFLPFFCCANLVERNLFFIYRFQSLFCGIKKSPGEELPKKRFENFYNQKLSNVVKPIRTRSLRHEYVNLVLQTMIHHASLIPNTISNFSQTFLPPSPARSTQESVSNNFSGRKKRKKRSERDSLGIQFSKLLSG